LRGLRDGVGNRVVVQPERERDHDQPDGLPGRFEQQQRQHLERVAKAEEREQREPGQHAVAHALEWTER
jgi:hypothetical protein